MMRKKELVRLNEVAHVLYEKDTLQRIRSPFVVNLINTFQDDKACYLVLEYINGGDLFGFLAEKGHITIHAARFYAMQGL